MLLVVQNILNINPNKVRKWLIDVIFSCQVNCANQGVAY